MTFQNFGFSANNNKYFIKRPLLNWTPWLYMNEITIRLREHKKLSEWNITIHERKVELMGWTENSTGLKQEILVFVPCNQRAIRSSDGIRRPSDWDRRKTERRHAEITDHINRELYYWPVLHCLHRSTHLLLLVVFTIIGKDYCRASDSAFRSETSLSGQEIKNGSQKDKNDYFGN